jgi:biotin carboxyl carrier protein
LTAAVSMMLTMMAVAASDAVAGPAWAEVSGGTQAPSAPLAGGSEYGVLSVVTSAVRPVVSELNVPRTVTAGRLPRVAVRIVERGAGRTVYAQVAVIAVASHKRVLSVNMGWVHTSRTVLVRWPHNATLAPGVYEVSLNAHDHHGATLLRQARSSGEANLTVTTPPAPRPTPPAPLPAAQAPSTSAPVSGVPTPAQSALAGTVFPVQGTHSFGGPENRFGAPRDGGYSHQGQDVLTAEGTPVVLPLGGTILTTSYQAGGAGYYAVEHTDVGFDFVFAHCEAGSLAVSTGQAVSAGQPLCKAGQTGDATAPHLHFEMWVGGWQASGGEPIDPLPYLQAWETDAASG